MDPTVIDLSSKSARFISENSEIPPDITFKFTKDIDGDNKVAAHKFVLAMVSQVFRNMFFVTNTKDRSANEIHIKDTTMEAFQIMVEAIYNVKTMKESLKGKTIDEMFAVLYLVTKYKIPELELATKECIASFPVTGDNVLEVATDALQYEATFKEASHHILLACAKFLQPKFADSSYLLQFVADNGDRMATVHKLAVLIKDLPAPTCTNCLVNPCQHGTGIEETQFRVGLKVAYNPSVQRKDNGHGYWNQGLTELTGKVQEILADSKVRVNVNLKFLPQRFTTNTTSDHCLKWNEQCTFIFNCKEIRICILR